MANLKLKKSALRSLIREMLGCDINENFGGGMGYGADAGMSIPPFTKDDESPVEAKPEVIAGGDEEPEETDTETK